MKLLKVIGLLFVLAIIAFFFVGRHISKGIGDSVENSIIAVHKLSKSIDSTKSAKIKISDTIKCSDNDCEGIYKGPEFVEGSDIAHQFSNKMASKVGNKLKELYSLGIYSKVDFSNIEMSTVGMGSGIVEYSLKIAFVRVKEKCDAYTSFDHVGGWNHMPALSRRKEELKNVLIDGQTLDISKLETTLEGLQEYWIQWRNKKVQSDCK